MYNLPYSQPCTPRQLAQRMHGKEGLHPQGGACFVTDTPQLLCNDHKSHNHIQLRSKAYEKCFEYNHSGILKSSETKKNGGSSVPKGHCFQKDIKRSFTRHIFRDYNCQDDVNRDHGNGHHCQVFPRNALFN